MVRNISSTALAIASLSLFACGGGGGSGGSPPIAVTPPGQGSPPPTSSPPAPSFTYPAGLSGVSSAAQFVLLDTLVPNSDNSQIPAKDLTFRWLGQPATFGLSVAGVGEGELRIPKGTNPSSLQLVASSGQLLMSDWAIPERGRYSGRLYRYGERFVDIAFGLPTSAASLPTTGIRAYRVLPTYFGNAINIDVDFALRRVTGTIGVAWADSWGPYPPDTYTLTAADLPPGETEFQLGFTVPGSPAPGQLVGRFAGPTGEELLLTWRVPLISPYDGSPVLFGTVTILTSQS